MWTHATPDRNDSRPDSAAEHRASAGHDRNAEETSDKDTANAFFMGGVAQLVAHDRPGKAVGGIRCRLQGGVTGTRTRPDPYPDPYPSPARASHRATLMTLSSASHGYARCV